jgi:hypothetical protein
MKGSLDKMTRSPVSMRYRMLASLGMLGWLAGLPAPVQAGGGFACVRCTGPNQTYRCKVMSEEDVEPQPLRYFCMAQIARDHVHESCAIVRGDASCKGQDVSYVYQDVVEEPPARPAVSGTDPTKQQPKTLSDMTKPMMDASAKAGQAVGEATVKAGKAIGEATVKAGEAVGDATKRTLKCLGSALNGC